MTDAKVDVSSKSSRGRAAGSVGPPVTVWVLTVLVCVMAFAALVGPFLFAFPLGGSVGYVTGTLLLLAGVGYVTIAWRLRRGERAAWTAALVLPIVHILGLNILDLVLYGAIPGEDYPFMGVALAVVALLLLPTTRRFFTR